MKKKLEYTVIREGGYYSVSKKVEDMTEDGWEPLGGAQVVRDDDDPLGVKYYQTMIRRTHKPWWRLWK